DPRIEIGNLGIKAEPKILVTYRAAPTLPLKPLRVQGVRYIRDLAEVKHTGLVSALKHRRDAQLNGYDDAIFVDPASFITEGPEWNVGFFNGDQVVWPQGDNLPGVTMALLHDAYGPSVHARVNLAEIHGMEGAFATNASIGVRPISNIDGHELTNDHPT